MKHEQPSSLPNPVGRPSKFTDSCKAKLIEALKKGATYELACSYARVCFSTFRKWIKLGEAGDPEYIQFLYDIKAVEGEAVLHWLDVIDDAMNNGEWTAAAWKLERRHYKGYSKHTEVIGLSEDMRQMKDDISNGELKNGE